MAASPPDPIAISTWHPKVKQIVFKITALVLLGLALGVGYDWAAARLYVPERTAGFRLGVLHGALMPAALPTLLMGKDVPIFAQNNSGRIYKVGYIAGINLCGTLFFGLAFWRPRKR